MLFKSIKLSLNSFSLSLKAGGKSKIRAMCWVERGQHIFD